MAIEIRRTGMVRDLAIGEVMSVLVPFPSGENVVLYLSSPLLSVAMRRKSSAG